MRNHFLDEMGRFGNGKQENARLNGPNKQRKNIAWSSENHKELGSLGNTVLQERWKIG